MEQLDRAVQAELVAHGELHTPVPRYHPEMEAVHRRHNTRVRAIIERHGWSTSPSRPARCPSSATLSRPSSVMPPRRLPITSANTRRAIVTSPRPAKQLHFSSS